MTMRFVLKNNTYKYSEIFGKQIKKHPFYQDDISIDEFRTKIESISPETILDIIQEIPDTWLLQLNQENDCHQIVNVIWNNLVERINQVGLIGENLQSLKSIKLETEEELKTRVSKNKQLFIDKRSSMNLE